LDFAPIVVELAIWGDVSVRHCERSAEYKDGFEKIKNNKEANILELQSNYRNRLAPKETA